MKNIVKITSAILIFFIAFLGVVYFKELKHLVLNEKLVIIFDKQKDQFNNSPWLKHKQLFPDNFNPLIAMVDNNEYSKLNEVQRAKYDSIGRIFNSYPKKNIISKKGRDEFSISINKGEAFQFEYKNKTPVKISDVEQYMTSNLDSIIQTLQNNFMTNGQHIYIIEVDHAKNKAYKIKAKPVLYLYD